MARLPSGRGGSNDLRPIRMRRRSSLISSRLNQRWRPSTSTFPAGKEGSAASLPRKVFWLMPRISSATSHEEKRRRVLVISGEKVCSRIQPCILSERA